MVQRGVGLAQSHGLSTRNLIFGIDVWAQDTSDQGPDRVTWPRDGGGGTGTGIAVAELAKMGASAGIFAPAWPYEHFSRHHEAVDRAMWDGQRLPKDLECSCHPAHPHSRIGYQAHAITRMAVEHAAGSRSFFYTDFRKAFTPSAPIGKDTDGQFTSELGMQAVLPRLFGRGNDEVSDRLLFAYLAYQPPRLVVERRGEHRANQMPRRDLTLFKLGIELPNEGVCIFTYRKPATHVSMELHLHTLRPEDALHFDMGNGSCEGRQIQIAIPAKVAVTGVSIRSGEQDVESSQFRDTETLPIVLKREHSDAMEPRVVLEVFDLCIKPNSSYSPDIRVSAIRLQRRGQDTKNEHWRLSWECDPIDRVASVQHTTAMGMPHSDITGSCSHFLVFVNGSRIATTHSLELVVPSTVSLAWRDAGNAKVKVTCIGFDGRILNASTPAVPVRWPDAIEKDWKRVRHPIENDWKVVKMSGVPHGGN